MPMESLKNTRFLASKLSRKSEVKNEVIYISKTGSDNSPFYWYGSVIILKILRQKIIR
jgi:hypothetical protein